MWIFSVPSGGRSGALQLFVLLLSDESLSGLFGTSGIYRLSRWKQDKRLYELSVSTWSGSLWSDYAVFMGQSYDLNEYRGLVCVIWFSY